MTPQAASLADRSSASAAPAPPGARSATTQPMRISSEDCQSRLQDLCGPLLAYLKEHHQFPPVLTDLRKEGWIAKDEDLICPDTHKPYAYAPGGLLMPNSKGGVLVYDSEPFHGIRWAIEMVWPPTSEMPLALVIPLDDKTFHSLRSEPLPANP